MEPTRTRRPVPGLLAQGLRHCGYQQQQGLRHCGYQQQQELRHDSYDYQQELRDTGHQELHHSGQPQELRHNGQHRNEGLRHNCYSGPPRQRGDGWSSSDCPQHLTGHSDHLQQRPDYNAYLTCRPQLKRVRPRTAVVNRKHNLGTAVNEACVIQ